MKKSTPSERETFNGDVLNLLARNCCLKLLQKVKKVRAKMEVIKNGGWTKKSESLRKITAYPQPLTKPRAGRRLQVSRLRGQQFTVMQLLHAISSVHRVAVALGGSDTDSFARSCT
ncbi:hypothetical protein P5673_008366 [Acropora cervicornis]|uniref:Uncharacterized protein n=1 Tax=Acropora cervicornis TaxID=6130 RepID=A0AAD9QUC1_ACRCE|nr:hypothetical protein P5673_008366 [Acropora cervicornis]